MNKPAKKAAHEAASFFGRLGGSVKSKRKADAARKTLEIARKYRWKKNPKKTA